MNSFAEVMLYICWALIVIFTPFAVASLRTRSRRKKEAADKEDFDSFMETLKQEDEALKDRVMKAKDKQLLRLNERLNEERRKNDERPTITIGSDTSKPSKPKEHEISMQEEHDDQDSLLSRYANATHDIEMLTVMLQSSLQAKDAGTLAVQQVLQRSIDRAEHEATQLKAAYEHHDD